MGPYDPESAELPEVPGFRVIAAAGAGSRGVVFRARDLASQELVALKVLEPGYASSLADAPGLDVDANGRLDAARRSIGDLLAHLAAVDAPGLVTPRRVVEVARGGEGSGPALAFVMEFVDGDSLARGLQRNVRFAPARAAGIAREAAAALLAAHAGGFVHGGLHPGKLLLADERTRVLGTGLGETLPEEFRPAEAAGRTSPHVYAAHEVLAGDRPTEASDVFSLGAILYHLLTGLPPYKSRGLGALKVERADGPGPHFSAAEQEVLPPAGAYARHDNARRAAERCGAARGTCPRAGAPGGAHPTHGFRDGRVSQEPERRGGRHRRRDGGLPARARRRAPLGDR
ncbi:MAG: protein kinase domain-containing protein [Planctomycetota bacterium]